jgi:ferredoxin
MQDPLWRLAFRLQAWLYLAWSLVVSLLSPLWNGKRGLREFDASYKKDGFVRLRQADRKLLPTVTGCIACRLCDTIEPGISTMVLAGARTTSDAATQTVFSDAVLARAERICPTRVPLRRLSAWVSRHGNSLPPD